MPSKQINNPYDYGGDDSSGYGDGGGYEYFEGIAGGTITKGQVVKAVFAAGSPFVPGTNGILIETATAAATTVCGVALQSATAGQIVQVARSGIFVSLVTTTAAAVAVGDLLVASTAGAVITNNAATVGEIVGVALEANGSAAIMIPILLKLV